MLRNSLCHLKQLIFPFFTGRPVFHYRRNINNKYFFPVPDQLISNLSHAVTAGGNNVQDIFRTMWVFRQALHISQNRPADRICIPWHQVIRPQAGFMASAQYPERHLSCSHHQFFRNAAAQDYHTAFDLSCPDLPVPLRSQAGKKPEFRQLRVFGLDFLQAHHKLFFFYIAGIIHAVYPSFLFHFL